jgi:hypothetical protein
MSVKVNKSRVHDGEMGFPGLKWPTRSCGSFGRTVVWRTIYSYFISFLFNMQSTSNFQIWMNSMRKSVFVGRLYKETIVFLRLNVGSRCRNLVAYLVIICPRSTFPFELMPVESYKS